MVVELKTVERMEALDEVIERTARDIFDAATGTADGVVMVAVIAGHKGRLAAIVEAERRLAFCGKSLESAIDGRARDRRPSLVEARAKLARREKARFGAQDARDRLPGARLVFGFHVGAVLRPSLKSLPRRTGAALRRCPAAPAPGVRQNALTGPTAPA